MFNFLVIILVQALFLFYLCVRRKIAVMRLLSVLSVSMIMGLLFGYTFDSVFGILGLFTYTPQSQFALHGTGLTFFQLVINGLLSYGIAFATVYFLVPKRTKSKKLKYKNIYLLGMILSALIVGCLFYFTSKSLSSLFLSGSVVILLGEIVALLFNERGVILSLCIDRKYTTFIIFWINSISIGLLYEGVNYLFPFWVWLPGEYYSRTMIEVLVIVFGYVVLFHPMLIFWQLMQKKGWLLV